MRGFTVFLFKCSSIGHYTAVYHSVGQRHCHFCHSKLLTVTYLSQGQLSIFSMTHPPLESTAIVRNY